MTPTKIPPLWVVSANKPVLTSPSGTTFRMSYDRADGATTCAPARGRCAW